MEYKRWVAEYCGVACEIEEDKPDIGAYLYVFLPDGTSYGELQNSVPDCLQNAEEEYGITLNCWRKAPSAFA
jgi:hypothetical protein